MQRRDFLRNALAGGACVLAAPMINLGRSRLFAAAECSTRAIDVVGRSTVIDMLGLVTYDWKRLRRWHADPASFGAPDFRLLRSSGIDVFHPAVDLNCADPYEQTSEWLSGWNTLIDANPGCFKRVEGCSALESPGRDGPVGILLGMQNSDHFRTAADVREFYALGQRVSQLTYNGANRIGIGCVEANDTGLSAFGAEIVAEMNHSGMAIDVSHAGERTTMDTFAASRKPVLITHSNCRSLSHHPRCKPDAAIKAMAKTRGVMGITSIRAFVRQSRSATLNDALDHFDYVAKLVGVEHVGLGSDTDVEGFGRGKLDVEGLRHSRRVFDLADGLLGRGYSERDVELVLGGNFRRCLAEIFVTPDRAEPVIS